MAYTTIDDPSAYFQTATWSGNASTQSITNDGNSDLKPDWAWTKDRGIGYGHKLMDSSRGLGSSGKFLITNSNAAESAIDDYMMTFDTDGFSVGAGDAGFNASNDTYVTWQWKANGGTTSTNNDGNHTSVVQANQDAGFSIVTYTGTGNTSSTVGHGLGVTPNWIIFKRRDGVGNWDIQIDGTSRATLNLTEAAATNVLSSFSSTTFGLGSTTSNEKNANGSTYVAYCFAEKQGYSKFGSYVGNGNADGPFVYTGFKPAFVMLKSSSSVQGWWMGDTKRSAYNTQAASLYPNKADAEYTGTAHAFDFLSNGFKIRNNNSRFNTSGESYIYMAFAENPFVTSTGIPTTAR
jgi:hypothetical protein